ncbi:MAG: capsular polysaccharide biosynthesis protein [Paracoccaceae bacterium]
MGPGARASGADAPATRRRLYAYNGGLLWPGRLRRILTLAGYDLRLGRPGGDDWVAVWGKGPRAWRGEAMVERTGASLLRIEDAFLRSLRPGRAGDAPLGILIDGSGVHYDASQPSDLETLLATDPLDDAALLSRARDGIARLQASDISKYSNHDATAEAPPPGYVLVVDQLRGDASVRHSGVGENAFREMLVFAQEEHPGARILIKTHPETAQGLRPGYYGPEHAGDRVSLLSARVSPWKLLDGAVGVYTVSSQLGFEAILAGHRPRVFGRPFYAGWGLSADENPPPHRRRSLTRNQLFAAAMILAPVWYDPCRDRLCRFEEVLDQLEAEVSAYRIDHKGHVAASMRMWKRPFLRRFFGQTKPLRFSAPARAPARARAHGADLLLWGSETAPENKDLTIRRTEDGFLRSRGLGAALVAPLSLVIDDLGNHYDPSRESRLERLIAAPARPDQLARAEALVRRLVRDGLSKYNAGGALPDLPRGHRILVVGQVEDDASVRLGGFGTDNLALLERARAENPGAVILYKPHPDVVAGFRPGAIDSERAATLAEMVLPDADPAALIAAVDEVWTVTSLMGFEALLRGKPVTCLGTPFYAGWGLTRDLGPVCPRRRARPELAALAHAALIAYPRYLDPVSGRLCPPEVVVERLASGQGLPRGRLNRTMSKIQGFWPGYRFFLKR